MNRRQKHEKRAGKAAPTALDLNLAWQELQAVLTEEVNRLPEKYRAPFVFCCLEGMSKSEAARQLGWKEGTVSGRLAEARKRLQQRLTRRGLTLSAALCAGAWEANATAAVPAVLLRATSKAALGIAAGQTTAGVVSAPVAALVEGVTRTMFLGKVKLAAILLLTAGIVAAGVGSHLHRIFATPAASEPPASAPTPKADKSTADKPTTTKDDKLALRGRVLDPDGKPLADAKVYLSTYSYKDKSDPKVRAETDADGRFHFTATRAEVDQGEMVAAIASGFGPDWASLKEADGELTLRLVKDDVPIQGRVLNLEGRPIAGVTVRVVRVRKMPDEDLTPWLTALQAKPNDQNAVANVQLRYERIMPHVWGILKSPKFVKTGTDGRFQLDGFGRDRVVELRIEGPGIEYRNLTIITRSELEKGLPRQMHSATFDHFAAPSKPIRGTVREKGSGKPVAGIRVGGGELAEAFTDQEGYYEIRGIRKSKQYFLNIGYRNPPYINSSKDIEDTPGLEPITADLEVERALTVRVRVMEKGSGKPVPGLVAYAVRADNPNLKNYTTYPLNVASWDGTEKDGSYNLVALPGRGFVAIRANEDRFTRARVEGQGENSLFLTGTAGLPLQLFQFHAVVPINPSADDPKSLVCDIALDPGRGASGVVVGPDDRPLTGVRAAGLGSLYPQVDEMEVLSGRFTVSGLDARKGRTVIFWQEKSGLARAIVVRGEEKTPLKVRLGPRGALTGRLVDAAGQPRPEVEVFPRISNKQEAPLPTSITILGDNDLREAVLPRRAFTDTEGRFRIKGLIPGLSYDLAFGREGGKVIEQTVKDLTVKPDATVDVGEIKTKAPSDKDAKNESP